MDDPLISIIIPTYNRGSLIVETLDSIIKQTYKNWECIVVDDGSSDNTDQVLKEYCAKDSRIHYYHRPKDKLRGGNAARNYGFDLSKGEFINWFDSDDIMLPNKLEIQLEKLSKSNLSFIVCQTLVFEDSVNNILGLRKENIFSNDFFNDFITNEIKWLTQAPLIRRSFIIKNNLSFDESLTQSQERDFFVNLLSCVNDYLFDNTPLVLFRKHQESISHSVEYSRSKLDSNFRVNFNILKKYKNKLSKKSERYLKKILLKNLNISARNNDFKQIRKFNNLLNDNVVNLSIIERIKVELGLMTLKYFKKGDVLFKIKN